MDDEGLIKFNNSALRQIFATLIPYTATAPSQSCDNCPFV
jgi:hypothetical protein